MNQELIDKVYNSVDQNTQLSKLEQDRNQFGKNMKYKFSHSFPEMHVKSTLPSYYKDFKVRLSVENFDIGKVYNPPKNPTVQVLSLFPSLHCKKITGWQIEKIDKGLQMSIKCESEVKLEDLFKKDRVKNKLPQYYYSKYPNCEKVSILAVLTPDTFINIRGDQSLTSTILEKSDYDPQNNHVQFYQTVKEELYNCFCKKKGLQFNLNSTNIALLIKSTDAIRQTLFSSVQLTNCCLKLHRTLSGIISENIDKSEEFFYPLDLLMKAPKMTKVIEIRKCNQIEHEFPIGCRVVIGQKGKYDGYTGEVQGYQQGKLAKELLVKLNTKPIYMTDEDLKKYAQDDEVFVSLKFLSYKMKIKEEVLLDLLDSFPIKVNPTLPSASKLPKMLDVGLNVIRRHLNEVVPELARIHKADQQLEGREKYLQYRDLQLNTSVVKLIVSYYNNHPRIFAAITKIEKQRKKEKGQTISCSDIFAKQNEDPNIELVKLYIWLMRQHESQFASSTIASKVMSSKKIRNLISHYDKNIESKINLPDQDQIIVTIDANNAIPAIYSSKQYLYMTSQPFYHELGDQAIYIGTYSTKNAPFGLQCTIVGIIDDKFEVIFVKPFIGGTNLNGRCPPQRGLIVQFDEIYNLQGWSGFLQLRDSAKQTQKSWNGWFDIYKPTFREAIKCDKDVQGNRAAEASNILSSIVFQPSAIPSFQPIAKTTNESNIIATIKLQALSANGTDTIGEAKNKTTQPIKKVNVINNEKIIPKEESKTNQDTNEKKSDDVKVVPKESMGSSKTKQSNKDHSTYIRKTDLPKEPDVFVSNLEELVKEPKIIELSELEKELEQLVVSSKFPDETEMEELKMINASDLEKIISGPSEIEEAELEKIMSQEQYEEEEPTFLDVTQCEKEMEEKAQKDKLVVESVIEEKAQQDNLVVESVIQEKSSQKDNLVVESVTEEKVQHNNIVVETVTEDKAQEDTLVVETVTEEKNQKKKLLKKDIIGFVPESTEIQPAKQVLDVEKKKARGQKRRKNEEKALNFQQYKQYQQYLHVTNFQSQNDLRRKEQEQENIAQSMSALAAKLGTTPDILLMQTSLQGDNSEMPNNIFDSSQIEMQQAQGICQTISPQDEIQPHFNYTLNQEDLQDYEELERQYLLSIGK